MVELENSQTVTQSTARDVPASTDIGKSSTAPVMCLQALTLEIVLEERERRERERERERGRERSTERGWRESEKGKK